MLQIPNPGDGFMPPPGTMRYVPTFEELSRVATQQTAIEQWLLARNGRYDVRAIGIDPTPPLLGDPLRGEALPGYLCRYWLVTVHTPWHVYTITAPGHLGHWKGIEEGCRTIDRKMLETGQALDMNKDGSPL